MKRALILIQAFLVYLLAFSIRSILVLLGFVVVPIAFYFRIGARFPKTFWLWDNQENGIFGPPWFHRGYYDFWTCFKWCALRNPVNNLRFIALFNVTHSEGFDYIVIGRDEYPDPIIARQLGKPIWHLTLVKQKGIWYPSFWFIYAFQNKRHFRIRIGWKCTPDWIKEPTDLIHDDVGLTFQLMPYRKG